MRRNRPHLQANIRRTTEVTDQRWGCPSSRTTRSIASIPAVLTAHRPRLAIYERIASRMVPFEVVGVVSRGDDALDLLNRKHTDLMPLGLQLPGCAA